MPVMPSASRVKQGPTRYVPPFENGERMDQKTFHELYEQTPKGFRAELIGGVVHLPSPVTLRHGRPHNALAGWLSTYAAETDGTEAFTDITTILAEDSEPQPDVALVISPEAGGQTSVSTNDYLTGAPELAAEVAGSTATVDLRTKLADYERYGVREYLVILVREQEVRWFIRRKDRLTPMKPDAAGVLKSKVFPGLWLDTAGVFDRSARRLLATLKQGLASPEHARFAAKLAKKMNT